MQPRSLWQYVGTVCLIVVFASVAQAYESIAAYPILPAGYHSIKVFDNQSRFVGRLLPEKRYWVTIDRIPLFLQKAIVAVEDARFYEHGGVDLRGIARAAVKNVAKGRLAEGGSTITQQLIKNKYLSSEKSLDRKVNEGLMALELEKKYTKKQILEMYLNEIYYGNGAWGIAQAARIYFDKAPEELTDIESSFLAGIPKNPGRYNPLGKPVDVAKRRSIVLQRMVDVGVLSSSQLHQQTSHTVAPVPPNQAPWYLALVHAKLVERYGPAVFEQGGLEVTSAMDLGLQLKAEQILHDSVVKLSPQLQGALVAVDPVSGNLLAAVGGTSYVKGGFNRALQAKRQPGSSIKPLIYAAALEQGVTAASLWNDAAVSYPQGAGESWTPHNYDGKAHGNLTLRQALASSNNVIAVKLLETIGIPAFTELAAKNGLALHGNNLSLALGTEEVTLHDLVLAYAPFATGGVRTEPRSILRIYETYRKVWFENTTSSSQAISPATAFITTSMLKDVLTSGTARGLKKFSQKYPAAGKTGTTNDYRDAWFIGYTPQLVTGVWVGHDQPRPGGKGFTGGAVAAPIWERFMRQALAGKPATDFVRPDSVVSVTIDPTNTLLATAACPVKREEFFVAGTEPDDYCPIHGGEPVAAPAATPAAPPAPAPKP
ncbi:penicillin-binding protein, 1A family [Trichlorobacter thiogenes]|uniref:Penicillin-binding protein, 1A family n=1 Tax=Trichlorobacter thiogenes TaxID=115783 RepID=A0A1T4RJZ4_9BACT|nr:penicillin-binding protein, 1A family [Trichlorobacter thiogenes]